MLSTVIAIIYRLARAVIIRTEYPDTNVNYYSVVYRLSLTVIGPIYMPSSVIIIMHRLSTVIGIIYRIAIDIHIIYRLSTVLGIIYRLLQSKVLSTRFDFYSHGYHLQAFYSHGYHLHACY